MDENVYYAEHVLREVNLGIIEILKTNGNFLSAFTHSKVLTELRRLSFITKCAMFLLYSKFSKAMFE